VVRHDPLLPRPMAVFRLEAGMLEVLYKVTGRGTALLSTAAPESRLRVVGPLGRGFSLPERGTHALLVGGGTGIASLYDLAARAHGRGSRVAVLLGARSAADLMAVEDFEKLGVSLGIATEDGSVGVRGLVTRLLEESFAGLRKDEQATVYACGPSAMMRRVAELAARDDRPCQVSLENHMACGFGVCLGCAVKRAAAGFALVCSEGPVFDAARLDWAGVP
jgi:dihydroorotate dehydrogenase electron transfer subunit